MMVALLGYAYCLGVCSSRQIERRCQVDIAFRLISGNRQPDHHHRPVARPLRTRHDRLFTDVLKLCAEAGMVNVGLVALDSTKMAADASKKANRSYEHIAAQVDEMLNKAKQADAAEDRLFGVCRALCCAFAAGSRCSSHLTARLRRPQTPPAPPSPPHPEITQQPGRDE